MIVYLITNKINGKKYVGQTIQPIEDRWRQHSVYDLHKLDFLLYRALRKHGVENFEIKEIDGANDQTELNYREWLWIHKLETNSPEKGYNVRLGGRNGSLPEETKKKISEAQRGEKAHWWGKKQSDETKNKRADTFKVKGYPRQGASLSKEARDKISTANKGKKFSLEARAKMSANRSGAKNHKSKKVIDISNGKTWDNCYSCAKDLKVNAHTLYHNLRKVEPLKRKNSLFTNLRYSG
jgi:group I intron endonuclease